MPPAGGAKEGSVDPPAPRVSSLTNHRMLSPAVPQPSSQVVEPNDCVALPGQRVSYGHHRRIHPGDPTPTAIGTVTAGASGAASYTWTPTLNGDYVVYAATGACESGNIAISVTYDQLMAMAGRCSELRALGSW